MKCIFVVAGFFIAGTLADVPLSQFKSFKYKLTDPDTTKYSEVLKELGLTDQDMKDHRVDDIKVGTVLTVHAPVDEGGELGEYTLKWDINGAEPIQVTFTPGQPIDGKIGMKDYTENYVVKDNTIFNTGTMGEKTLKETLVFTDNKMTETVKCGDKEAKRVYVDNTSEATATPAA